MPQSEGEPNASPAATGWSTIQVGGHDCDIFEPARPHPLGLVVMYLHGVRLNRLVGKPVFQAQFERHGLRVVAPQTARSWWSDKICPEFDPQITAERYVLDRVLPYIAQRWNIQPPAIGLLGTSMGGQGALRFSMKHPRAFPVVAAIAPAIDFQWRYYEDYAGLQVLYPDPEAARQDTATLHVHPLNWPRHTWFCCDPLDDPWRDSADKLRMKLGALGVPYVCDLETSGGGHSFAYYDRMAPAAIDFITERLEQESRRV